MIFSKKELAAILNVGRAMINADGRVDENELAVVSMELMRFGLPEDDLDELFQAASLMEPSEAMAIISILNKEQKKYVSSFLGAIMASDGDIDDRELALWMLVSSLCGLPKMTVAEAVANIAENI